MPVGKVKYLNDQRVHGNRLEEYILYGGMMDEGELIPTDSESLTCIRPSKGKERNPLWRIPS